MDLYVGTAAQVAEWTAWPGRNGGDALDIDALDRGDSPPRAWSDYSEVVFWYTPEGRAAGDEAYTRAQWARETFSRNGHGGRRLRARMERFGPEEERAVEAAREAAEEAFRVAPEIRHANLVSDRRKWHKAERQAKRELDAEELAALVGEREKVTARTFADQPKPTVVMEHILAAEVNLLAGPEASGKSLWERDLALSVAAGEPWRGHAVPEARNVLLVFSEGTHDFAERFTVHPLWERAADRVWVLDKPVNLTVDDDVDWLLRTYGDERPGLVCFDVVYGMGMADDSGVKDVLPVLNSMKRISAEWQAATLAVGHPPHGDARRMRGSSMWRHLAYTDWFMGGGKLTCEKSKIDHAGAHVYPYAPSYPFLRWVSTGELLAEESMRFAIIEASIDADPKMSVRKRAADLAPDLGVGITRARQLISDHLKARGLL
jgi:hypothetical protein